MGPRSGLSAGRAELRRGRTDTDGVVPETVIDAPLTSPASGERPEAKEDCDVRRGVEREGDGGVAKPVIRCVLSPPDRSTDERDPGDDRYEGVDGQDGSYTGAGSVRQHREAPREHEAGRTHDDVPDDQERPLHPRPNGV